VDGQVRHARGGVVVLGGGFAGASVARELGHLGCTLVAPDTDLAYTPLLAEAASGEVGVDRLAVPLRAVCPRAEILRGRATAIDRTTRAVTVETGANGAITVGYEQLVVAVGAVEREPTIPGLREPLLGVRTVPQVLATRAHVLAQVTAAAAETDPPKRRRLLTFVVVGGGYVGVEALAELQALVRDAARDHRSLKGAPQRWVLVEAAPAILAGVPARLVAYTERQLEDRGVEILTSTTLTGVENGVGLLSDGGRLDAATVIWTAGSSANPLVASLGLPVDGSGRLLLRATLQVEDDDRVWAAGDCAAVPNAATPGRTDPATSQHALRQARRIARNVRAVRHGRSPEPYRFLQLGQVATLGRYNGIADVFGLQLSGLPGWIAARGVHLLQYPDPVGRLGVVNDWALSFLLRRDTRSPPAREMTASPNPVPPSAPATQPPASP
jgi:NADH:ubiquinone reductase (H+-translocating)